MQQTPILCSHPLTLDLLSIPINYLPSRSYAYTRLYPPISSWKLPQSASVTAANYSLVIYRAERDVCSAPAFCSLVDYKAGKEQPLVDCRAAAMMTERKSQEREHTHGHTYLSIYLYIYIYLHTHLHTEHKRRLILKDCGVSEMLRHMTVD